MAISFRRSVTQLATASLGTGAALPHWRRLIFERLFGASLRTCVYHQRVSMCHRRSLVYGGILDRVLKSRGL